VEEDWFSPDFQQRLWDIGHARTEPSPASTRQDADGRQLVHSLSGKPRRDSTMYLGRRRTSS
jgi:hypothetical protein